ncbi:Spindle and centriole-associated protein 1 [Lamellibrachia satsuma]|nr:Spindle and centriole-associated protein 1 [Lamellibrachia satsuma]
MCIAITNTGASRQFKPVNGDKLNHTAMSFVRLPRKRYPTRQSAAAKAAERKKVSNKPEWDDTTNDLSVYKASPEEMLRRAQVTKSQNMDLVKADLLKKKIAKAKSHKTSPRGPRGGLLREVLLDNSELQETLAASDKTMAIVKDLFGDDPKRYRGLPNVTVAPERDALDGSLPDGTVLEGRFKLDVLSDSVMDKTALNDMDTMQSESSFSGEEHEPLSYEPVMDMQRFQRLLQEADREERQTGPTSSILQDLARKLADRGTQSSVSQTQATVAIPREVPRRNTTQQRIEVPLTPDGNTIGDSTPTTPYIAAMNDTEKVHRTMARTNANSDGAATIDNVAASQTLAKLDDLRSVLDGLECSISDYERQTGRAPAAQRLVQPTFSGYTTALIDAVTRLTAYLKESEMRLRVESTLREQLTQDVSSLTTIVDALTSDIIATQEEYAMMKMQFDKFKTTTEQEIHTLKQTLGGQGVWMPTPMYPAAQMVRPQHTQLQQTLRPQALSSGQYVPLSQPGSVQQMEPQTARSSLDSNGMAPEAGSVYQRVGQKMEPQTAWVSHVDNEALSQTGNLYQHVTQQMEPQAARVSQDGSTVTMSESPGTAVSQAAQLLRDGAQAMSQLGLAYESTSLGIIPRSVARKLELPSAETRNAPRPSLSESSLLQPRVPGDVRQSQSWPAIPPQGMPRGWMSAQHGEVACAAVPSMSEQVPVVRGSLPSPNIPSSAAVLLSAPKQMQSPQVSGSKCWPSTQPQPAGYVPGRPTQRPQGDMLPPATWSPDGPREGGDNNLARQLYFSQMLPPGGASQSMRGEVGQGDVEEELKKAEEERRELHRQLEALNLQHREAQGKLQSMQQQQQQGPGVKRQSVSPSISPISHVMTEDEQCSVSGEKQRAGDMWEAVSGRNTAREITVSLPRVEMINANSPLSPEDGRPSMPAVRPSEPRYNVTAVQAM